MKKYRVVEYSNGTVAIEAKSSLFRKWQNCYIGNVSVTRALEMVNIWKNEPKVTKKVHKC